MVRTQIQLTEKQAKALKRMASDRHVSMAELVREAVDSIVKSGQFPDEREKWERAASVVGKYRSGKRDISVRHDKYLAEIYSK